MSLGSDCNLWPNDFRATFVALHVRATAIGSHVLAAVHLRLGHLFAWKKTSKLWYQDRDNHEHQR